MKTIDLTEKDIRNFDWENQRNQEDEKELDKEFLQEEKKRGLSRLNFARKLFKL